MSSAPVKSMSTRPRTCGLPRRTTPRARFCSCPRASRCGSTATSCSRPSASPTRPTATLNAAKSNAILVCHALTGDQYVASEHPVTGKPGWWETMVGPGKPVDTDRFFVICPNVLGGCMGSTGPPRINPQTGKPCGLDFPVITIGDMVDAQVRADRPSRHRPAVLRDRRLDGRHAGAGMGGAPRRARVLRRADRDRRLALLAEHRLPRGRAPGGHGRSRLVQGRLSTRSAPMPRNGLAVARMAAHITYLSEEALQRKFGRNLQDARAPRPSASTPTSRWRAICATRARPSSTASTPTAISTSRGRWTISTSRPSTATCWPTPSRARKTRFCVVSFTSDWLYPTRESREIVQALNAVAANVSFVEIETDKGHDAFLLDEPEFFATVRGFLNAAAEKRGLKRCAGRRADARARDPDRRHAPRRPPADRRDGGSRARACSTSAAATARCCSCWPTPRSSTGAASRSSRERVNACVARGLSVIQGDADRDLADYPDERLRLRHPEPHHPGDAPAQDRAREPAAHRPQRHRLVPQLRPLAGARASCCSPAACR